METKKYVSRYGSAKQRFAKVEEFLTEMESKYQPDTWVDTGVFQEKALRYVVIRQAIQEMFDRKYSTCAKAPVVAYDWPVSEAEQGKPEGDSVFSLWAESLEESVTYKFSISDVPTAWIDDSDIATVKILLKNEGYRVTYFEIGTRGEGLIICVNLTRYEDM